jgi:serine/threonine protein kinase/tetratricopeptide (TPR) repeat protein
MVSSTRVREIFELAQELSGAGRAEFLEARCAGEPALRAEVESLLRCATGAGAFLSNPTAAEPAAHPGPHPTAPAESPAESPGARIGLYKLLQKIGEGGFGVVFLAEQQTPVVRRVALKVIKLGMDTRAVIARFEAERQALAMMDHPNIARVLDAGATDAGRPYFVMELVRGEPITQYCDRAKLGTRQRLDLFIAVCQAVQHAHQKGVIHRDIKPGNVLVTVADGRPIPKVIDFGIAKATHGRLTQRTLFTEHRQLIGTPEYMSPEQAEMSGVDIDTRSDIYSLGVLLYELLTGTTPFDPRTLRSAALAEINRIIREVEPEKPSTRLGTLGQELRDTAARRGVEPARLGALVRGDLDWVTMKCLEKDRSRRYDTAAALSVDLQRHLAGEPVAAAPPSRRYRAVKLVRRHRASIAATGAVSAALLAGLAGFAWQAHRVRLQRDMAVAATALAERSGRRAGRIMDFMTESLGAADPERAGRAGVSVGEVMLGAVARAETFRDEPETRAGLLAVLAEILTGTGKAEAALPLAEESLALYRRVHRDASGPGLSPGDHPDVARALDRVVVVLYTMGQCAKAKEYVHACSSMFLRLHADSDNPERLRAGIHAMRVLLDLDRRHEVHAMRFRRAQFERAFAGRPEMAEVDEAFALLGLDENRPEDAKASAEECLALLARLYPGRDCAGAARALRLLALALHLQGKSAEAEPLLRESLSIDRRLFIGDHWDLALGMCALGRVLSETGRCEEALPHLRESGALRRRLFAGPLSETARHDLARCVGARGPALDPGGAGPECQRLLAEFRAELITPALAEFPP